MEQAGAIIGEDGLKAFLEALDDYAEAVSDVNIQDVLMAGGIALRDDVRKLPKPRQPIVKPTHMLDLVDAEAKSANSVQVGWTKEGYYGVFVERGTKHITHITPHIGPTWNNNKNHYYQLMADKLHQKGGL